MRVLKSQRGFTIIELMFATTIFSGILLLSLAALVQIGKLYYKGVTTSQTQQVARNILDEISQSVQLSAGPISSSVAPPAGPDIPVGTTATGYFCIGDTRYTYAIDREQTDGTSPNASLKQISHVLWADTVTNCGGLVPPILPAIDLTSQTPGGVNGHELVGAHMRLLVFNVLRPVASAPDVWRVDLTVGYGDDDLFKVDTAATPHRKFCATTNSGTQFCATSELSTIVNRRVQ